MPYQQTPEQRQAALTAAGVSASSLPAPIAVSTITSPQTPLNVQAPTIAPVPALVTPPPPTADPTKPPAAPTPSPFLAYLESLQAQASGKTLDTAATKAAATAPYEKQLADYTQQLAARQAQALANQEKALKTGETIGYASREAQNIQRTDAIEIMKLQALQAGAQGNVALAEKQAQLAIDTKYGQIEKNIEAAKSNIYNNYDSFSAAEKKRANATLLRLDSQDAFVADQKANEALVFGLVKTALSYGADTATIEKMYNASSPQQAATIGSKYLQDPKAKYELESAKLGLDIQRAQLRKLNIENQSLATAGAPIPSTSDYGTPAQGLKSAVLSKIGTLKLTEDQAKSVSYAFRMIEANKNINDQVGDGTKKGSTLSPLGGGAIGAALVSQKPSGKYDPTTIASAFGRFFHSDNARAFDRDMSNFNRAQLRKESGATILPEEDEASRKLYSPEGVMTNQKDIQQTRQARDQAIQSMIATAGPASAYIKQYADYIASGGLTPEEQAIIDGGSAIPPPVINGLSYY